MILGFSTVFPWGGKEPKFTHFPQKILDGRKIHTARIDEHDRWKPGRIIQFSIGVRTKKYKQFALGRCTQTPKLIINPEKERVFIEHGSGIVYRGDGVLAFARNDGFDSLEDFWRWFNKPFEGKLIYWTLFENGRGE
ncbi:unnamed protein product [Leptospira phage LE1]|uniref:Uncharacterized protein n=1 Tax=Leptospira phage LE1 TaxID=137511 RepID=Q6NDX8_9CAUD|nr:hypothetical protein HWD53_gp65 [Leptospira phage LE1]CAE14765.1 unnamed protein product [Leptospira phage LE1]